MQSFSRPWPELSSHLFILFSSVSQSIPMVFSTIIMLLTLCTDLSNPEFSCEFQTHVQLPNGYLSFNVFQNPISFNMSKAKLFDFQILLPPFHRHCLYHFNTGHYHLPSCSSHSCFFPVFDQHIQDQ